jgi:hypothetical protein
METSSLSVHWNNICGLHWNKRQWKPGALTDFESVFLSKSDSTPEVEEL